MNRGTQRAVLAAAALTLIGLGAAIGYSIAHRNAPAATAGSDSAKEERTVLYWYDPMVPNQHFDKPGKSPFMDMELVPKYADDSEETAGVRVSPVIQQNLGIRLAPVQQRSLDTALNAVGTITFNERELATVQARTNGFVSRVYGRAPGDILQSGAPLVDMVVPEWGAAQQELIALRDSGDAMLVEAARARLHALGLPAEVIHNVERSGRPQTTVTITTPITGVLQSIDARIGTSVSTGMTLAQINALNTVWLMVSIPEAQGSAVAVGDRLTAELPALGSGPLAGRVTAILPQADQTNRTLTVRAELPNADGRLRPGQYARVHLSGKTVAPTLTVPSEAVIRSGRRTVVIVAEGDRFRPAEVQVGREADGLTEVRAGLQADQQVVVSGQFLLDSEANLSGVMRQMGDTEQGGVQ